MVRTLVRLVAVWVVGSLGLGMVLAGLSVWLEQRRERKRPHQH